MLAANSALSGSGSVPVCTAEDCLNAVCASRSDRGYKAVFAQDIEILNNAAILKKKDGIVVYRYILTYVHVWRG